MELELVNLVTDNTKTKETIPFPIDNIDTSWMTKSQKKIFDVVKNEDNRDKKYDEICKLTGFKSYNPWYNAIKDEKFADLLENLGVKVRLINDAYSPHNEVEYLKDPKEREAYLKEDEWDMRKLFKEYPRHHNPENYIVKF